jgi:OOP family OmpA-OmpF porin
MRRTRATATATATATALAVLVWLPAACDGAAPRREKHSGQPEVGHPGPLAKDAWSGVGAQHSMLVMKDVERFPGRSVLRFYVTNLGKESAKIEFPASLTDQNIDFRLVDPVGRKAYTPLRDASDSVVGSEPSFSDPGVRYEAVLDFPPIPPGVDKVTVLTPSTAGEFTSVPVVQGSGPMTPVAPTPTGDGTPPGNTLSWPMADTQGPVKGSVRDLYGITEDAVKSTATSGTEEKVALRTDVLFAFDSANLSPAATSILDGVAAEARQKADPATPPVLIEGHTDGKGTHDYNITLSQRRADAVLKELRTRLGGGYQYRTAAKGETEPVAEEGGADDAKARARNRRVEISYRLKPATRGGAATSTQGAAAGGTAPPAPFRPSDGGTVASRTADFNTYDRTRRRVDVKPFYRDGAYLVAAFEITNLGPGELKAIDDYSGLTASHFGTFGVIDPHSKTEYRGVRAGPETEADGTLNLSYVDPDWVVFNTAVNTANRGFFYVPAPPPDVRSVTFDAGVFGQIPGVPIR